MNFQKYYFIEDEDLAKFAKKFQTAQDFLRSQYTGFIQQSVYDNMSFTQKIEKTPELLRKFNAKNGEVIEFRKTGEKLKYVKWDKEKMVRDEKGLALYMSDDEVLKKGYPTEDTTIYAFNSKGENVGYASDEFGVDGVWVKPEYQRQCIGTELLIELKKQFKHQPDRKIGQMTPAGMEMAKSFYRKLTGVKKPDVKNVLVKFKEFLKTYDDNDTSHDKPNDIRPETSEPTRSLIRFEKTINNDERFELDNYFMPTDYSKPKETLEDFYERNKQ